MGAVGGRASAVSRRALWRMAARPSFVVIGAQKAGTTSLYDYLSRLPGIRPARRKEVHYFDANYDRGRAWYASQFPLRVGDPDWMTGEASPYYLLHPWAPVRLASDLPAAKIVVILRNPVDRAYSAWSMRRGMGIETLDFPGALERERSDYPAEHAALLADPRRDSTRHRLLSYAVRGRYLEQLQAWETHVPRARIHVMLSERLFADPAAELAGLHGFLGVPASPDVGFPVSNPGRYDDLSPALRRSLEAEFHEPNAALASHLGIDLHSYGWS